MDLLATVDLLIEVTFLMTLLLLGMTLLVLTIIKLLIPSRAFGIPDLVLDVLSRCVTALA